MAALQLRSGLVGVMERAVEENRLVGTVVCVAHRGEVCFLHASGFADRELNKPMSTDAIFLLASVSKPLVSAAALAMIDRGLFDLETPVTRHLPGFRPKFRETSPQITVRHLMTHTSGLSYPFQESLGDPYHAADVSTGLDLPGLPADEALRRLASVPLLFEPGTQWKYSLATDVLGLFMSAAAGKSLSQIVREAVTEPLGMRDTDFGVRDQSRLVVHYGVDGDGRLVAMGDTYLGPTLNTPVRMSPGRVLHPKSYPSGGGGMCGTATDLMTFFEALRMGGSPVINPRSAAMMTRNALPAEIGYAIENGWTYGLGTHTLSDRRVASGPERAGAFRGSGGYGHTWFVDPALGLTVVALTNSAPEGVRGGFVSDVRQMVYAAIE